MPVIIKPDVVDVSVWNSVEDWDAVKRYGVKGIIHKSSQGSGQVDKRYAERKGPARRAGLLWGCYHFADASPALAQAKHFLAVCQPDPDMLLALDWEGYGGNTMSLASAKEFLRIVYEETGQRPVLYSGNLLKEQGRGDPFLTQHRLWLAQYAPTYQLPRGWTKYWLWQFSGDSHNGAGIIPGISTKGMDCNLFGGDDIVAEWAGRPQDRRQAPAPAAAIAIASGPAAPVAQPAAKATPDKAVGFIGSVTTASTSAAAINELSEQGSRLAQTIRSVKQWFWRGAGATAVGAGVVPQTVDPTKGNAAIVTDWVHAHPLWFAIIIGSVLGVGIYLIIKLVERYVVTAYNAGRYSPRAE